jgi:coenzyme F420-reducing hydrogenase delta subunit
LSPDVVVYVCQNCFPEGGRLPRQWRQSGAHVLVQEVPCSGKIDGQYLLHSLEGGVRGFCVAACPKGECSLVEGNYRAEVRIRTIRRLLREVGLESGRAELVVSSPKESPEQLERLVRGAVDRVCALGDSPLRNA